MVYVLIVLLLSYSIVVIRFTNAWNKSQSESESGVWGSGVGVSFGGGEMPLVSVVVAARNEEERLPALLHDLARQDYPDFEVIVVDDHSEDGTAALVGEYAAGTTRFTVVGNAQTGKKQALTTGIAAARGEIIITTDADCRVSSAWVGTLARYFQRPRVQMAFGPVRMRADDTFFSQLQQLEFASLTGAAAATHQQGYPAFCNGANLAFRKAAFHEVGGYADNTHIPSGDDEFLMRKIIARYPQSLVFAGSRQAIVTTDPQPTTKAFVHQRLRWAGKWKHNTSLSTKLLAIYILLVQLAFITLPIFVIAGAAQPIMLVILLWRLIVEAGYLYAITRFLGLPFRLTAFVTLQLIYPVYVTSIGLLSWIMPYEWKGRPAKSE